MILYISCNCGRNKLIADKYRKQGYEIRVTRQKQEWRKEAKEYGLKPPFKVVDGVASNV